MCTSLDVAETFSKEHYHVIEDIRKIQSNISSPEFTGLFFEDSYIASNGKRISYFRLAYHFTNNKFVVSKYTYKVTYITSLPTESREPYKNRAKKPALLC